MIAEWVLALATGIASFMGSASLIGTLLVKRGFSREPAGIVASGFGQAVAALVILYFMTRVGLAGLFAVDVSTGLLVTWLVITAAAFLVVVVSDRLNAPANAPAVKEFLALYRVCRPCFFILPLLVAPVCEEILFRGAVQAWLGTIVGVWPALLVAVTAFTLAHVRALGFSKALIPVAAMATLLGLPVLLYGTLVPSMITHALSNIVGMRNMLIPSRANQFAWVAGEMR